jgi:peptidoglycan hydrolase-like protein with peptidoglycan-binding domain
MKPFLRTSLWRSQKRESNAFVPSGSECYALDMKKLTYSSGTALIFGAVFVPQLVLAAWWNPLTWPIFVHSKPVVPAEHITATTTETMPVSAAASTPSAKTAPAQSISAQPASAQPKASSAPRSAPAVAPASLPVMQTPPIAQNPTLLSKDLGIGDNGPEVKLLQKYLDSRGMMIYGYTEGIFGDTTQHSVADYQASIGISATGFVGAVTRASINAQLTNPTPTTLQQSTVPITSATPVPSAQPAATTDRLYRQLVRTDSGPDVYLLQSFLRERNFLGASDETTLGSYGVQTEGAVYRYQLSAGIPASGKVDIVTMAKVNTFAPLHFIPDFGALSMKITSISPRIGKAGTQVIIDGSGFADGSAVKITGPAGKSVSMIPTSRTANQMIIYIPDYGPGNYTLQVERGDYAGDSALFSVTP